MGGGACANLMVMDSSLKKNFDQRVVPPGRVSIFPHQPESRVISNKLTLLTRTVRYQIYWLLRAGHTDVKRDSTVNGHARRISRRVRASGQARYVCASARIFSGFDDQGTLFLRRTLCRLDAIVDMRITARSSPR